MAYFIHHYGSGLALYTIFLNAILHISSTSTWTERWTVCILKGHCDLMNTMFMCCWSLMCSVIPLHVSCLAFLFSESCVYATNWRWHMETNIWTRPGRSTTFLTGPLWSDTEDTLDTRIEKRKTSGSEEESEKKLDKDVGNVWQRLLK